MKVSTELSHPRVLLSSLAVVLVLADGWIGRRDHSTVHAAPPPQALHPMVTVTVVSAADGDTIPARCSITDVYGSDRYPPAGSSFYHDVEEGYFYTTGVFSVAVPEGNAIFRAGRGFEYVPTVQTIPIAGDTSIVIRLGKVCDPLATGIFSGDVHLHLNHGPGYYVLDPSDARMIAMAEGLSVMNCLDNEYYFTGGPDECSDDECVVYMTEERRSGVWG
ncbi:MAG TPA: hypothetical protein VLA34_06305, partial [Candidatus Krumholzibacterium sp.]|nr:hypothetical protein [Candidatus Krumholzibacterium sp.]